MRGGTFGEWPVRAEMVEQFAVAEQTAVTLEEVRPVGPPPMPPSEPPPDREIWPWLLALLVFVLAGIAALYFGTRDDHKSRRATTPTQTVVQATPPAAPTRKPAVDPRATVPRLVGLPAPIALKTLQRLGLAGTTHGIFSKKPRNQVVSQVPGASRTVAKGATVKLDVSKGAKAAPVPDVVGQNTADALTTIKAQGFKAKLVRVPSDQPAGQVVAQHPKAGESVPAGSAIRLNLSDGARASTTGPSGTTRTLPATTTAQRPPAATTRSSAPATSSIAVPDLTGRKLVDARATLRRIGLVIEIRRVPNSLSRDTIVAQTRKPGTTLKRGDHMLVTVSSGPHRPTIQSITVPDVTGEDETAATQDLHSAGLTVRVIDQNTTDPSEDGVVIKQTPAANQSAPAKSAATIYVGRYTFPSG
jgi:beta-lactam-binding protein with PASTA domain